MVQVLPGFAPQLGESLASIIGSVNNIIDPDYQLKKQIHQKILSDPEYAQKLANFAYLNPDAYKKLGLDKIGEQVSAISPDLKTVMEEAQKGFVAKAAATPNEELAKEAGQKLVYGQTESDVRARQLKEVQAGINIALSRQRQILNEQGIREGQAKLAQLDLEAKGIEEATANYEQLKGTNLGKLADSFLAGNPDPSLLTQIYSTPQLAKPFGDILKVKEQQLQYRRQIDLSLLSHSLSRRSSFEDAWLRTGVGTPKLWEAYATDPKTQQRLFDLVRDPKQATTPEDQMLLQMHESMIDKQLGKNSAAARTAITAMTRIIDNSHDKGANKEEAVAQLNFTFNQLAQATGDFYKAQIATDTVTGPPRWGGLREGIKTAKSGIQIIDMATGKPVDPTYIVARSSGAPVFPPSGNNIKSNPNENKQKALDDSANKAKAKDAAVAEQAYQNMVKAGLSKSQMLQEIMKSKKLTDIQKAETRKRAGI